MNRIILIFIFNILLCGTIIKAQEKFASDSLVQIFVAVDAHLRPDKGIENFKLQWINYLDSINQVGILSNEERYSDSSFHVIVSIMGFSVRSGDAAKKMILSGFLKTQKRWSLGIQSGKPIVTLLKMKIPKQIFQGVEKNLLLQIPDLIALEDLYTIR